MRSHLGLIALYHASKLCSSLNELLEASEISVQLQETAKSCLAYVNNKGLSQNEKKILREGLSEKLGDLAAWAFMLGCIQKSCSTKPTDEIKRSERWAKQLFNAKLDNLLEDPLDNIPVLNADEINTLINQYTDEIGNLEQTLAGEENKLDEYLRRDLIDNLIP